MCQSVYPPHLTWGSPKRHHLVVYLHVRLCEPWTAEQVSAHVRLQVEETDMCVWLPHDVTQCVANVFEQDRHMACTDTVAPDISVSASSPVLK